MFKLKSVDAENLQSVTLHPKSSGDWTADMEPKWLDEVGGRGVEYEEGEG